MAKTLELALLGVGGTSLFSVCFLGFASITGVPMHSVPILGSFYEAPEPIEESPIVQVADPTDSASLMPQRSLSQDERKVIENSIASLAPWALPPPYDIEEVAKLINEVTAKRSEIERRQADLDKRETELAEELLRLQQRGTQMDEMRRSLEGREASVDRKEAELAQVAGELERPELFRTENAEKELLRKSLFFASGDVDEVAKRLISFPSGEAAAILHKLGDDARAVSLLNALPAENWQEYMEAYAKTAP